MYYKIEKTSPGFSMIRKDSLPSWDFLFIYSLNSLLRIIQSLSSFCRK